MRFSNLVQQVKEVSRPEWFAASALSVAMFSVGFSVSVAACSTHKGEPPVTKPEHRIASVVNPPAPPAGRGSGRERRPGRERGDAPVAQSVPCATSPRACCEPARREALRDRERGGGARAGARRERVRLDPPLFAFAELENAGDYEQKVRITFELQGESDESKSVGHVELAVPASSARWRTWAKTQLVDAPGQWAAVLRDEQGHELARTPFEVKL